MIIIDYLPDNKLSDKHTIFYKTMVDEGMNWLTITLYYSLIHENWFQQTG